MTPAHPRRGTARGVVVLVLGVALALRLAAVIFASGFSPCCDADDYIRHAESIASGHGYPVSKLVVDGGPTALRPPVYPYLVGALFTLKFDRLGPVRVVQAVLGTVTVGLLGLLAWQVFGDRRPGVVAAGLAAVYPPFVLWPTAILSENVFLPLEVGALVAAWQFRRDAGRLRFAVLAGLVVGLATETRQPGVIIVLPVALAILTARAIPAPRRRAALLCVALAAGIVVSPWALRNLATMHTFAPVGVQTGIQLAGAYNEDAAGSAPFPAMWRPPTLVRRDAALFARHGIGEVALDRALTAHAIDYIRAHPGYVFTVVLHNGLRMLHLDDAPQEHLGAGTFNLSDRLYALDRWGFWAAALLAIGGLGTRKLRAAPVWLWIAPAAFFLAAAALAGEARYRTPIDPFVLMAAAAALVAAWDRLSPGLRRGGEDPAGRSPAPP